MSAPPPIITLLTDFGTQDSYVAEVKAVLLSAIPTARLVDITHEAPPGDLRAAQYLLGRAWHRFPAGTVHLAVVDPGVGTARRAIAAENQGHRFVGPDNGLLTPVLEGARTVAIPVPPYASATFQGRDVFAPAAARLALGAALETLGALIDDPVHTPPFEPRRVGNELIGTVIHVDRFGTLITDIGRHMLDGAKAVAIGSVTVLIRRTFGDVREAELVAFVGSGGTLEIAIRGGSAAEGLGAPVGVRVRVIFGA